MPILSPTRHSHLKYKRYKCIAFSKNTFLNNFKIKWKNTFSISPVSQAINITVIVTQCYYTYNTMYKCHVTIIKYFVTKGLYHFFSITQYRHLIPFCWFIRSLLPCIDVNQNTQITTFSCLWRPSKPVLCRISSQNP